MGRDLSGANNPFYGRRHSPETRAKLSEIAQNRVFSEETKQKMSESKMGELNSFYGRQHSKESKMKISVSKQGQKSRLGTKHTPEAIAKMAEVKMGNRYSVGHTMPLESRLKLSRERKGNWMAEYWADPEFKRRTLRAIRASQNTRPNGCESRIIDLLDEIQPNVWEYVGDWTVDIGNRNPDFYNGNDKVIEHFGDYWHGERARCYEETEEGRIAHFAKYGFQALIIWEHELGQPKKAKAKIKAFVGVSEGNGSQD